MHRLGGIEMNVKITTFKDGIKQNEKEFTIPRRAYPKLIMKAEKMYSKNPRASFTIEIASLSGWVKLAEI